MNIQYIFLLCAFLLPVTVTAQSFNSGTQRVSVLELYTSEGCSSCPPADRWISQLKGDSRLWTELIPLAFHVDYWNYIGWTDRFASDRYSERQRRYARADNVSTVYTPGFVLNGKEWRSFFGLRRLSLDNNIAGELKVNLDGKNINATYSPDRTDNGSIHLNIAILGFDLETQVQAGENRGKILKHDFTVLQLVQKTMYKEDGIYLVNDRIPDFSGLAPRMAIAVWVNKGNDQTPLQATGGWLTE